MGGYVATGVAFSTSGGAKTDAEHRIPSNEAQATDRHVAVAPDDHWRCFNARGSRRGVLRAMDHPHVGFPVAPDVAAHFERRETAREDVSTVTWELHPSPICRLGDGTGDPHRVWFRPEDLGPKARVHP
jgi:hypothetical protein